MSVYTFEKMLGRTMTSVIASGDVMLFIEQNGSEHRFYHEQDCCEIVEIEDIEGDLNDLVGILSFSPSKLTRNLQRGN